jgi:hypothetical protein
MGFASIMPSPYPLLATTSRCSIWQPGEGAIFPPHGLSADDLTKHKVWVCPPFEQFRTLLYQQALTDLDQLPDVVRIDHQQSALQDYRRPGVAVG